jgi:hypothetical protein
MHKNYHFIVMLSQMILRVSAHQRHLRGAHTILTTVHRFQPMLIISTYIHSAKLLIGAISLDIPLLFL